MQQVLELSAASEDDLPEVAKEILSFAASARVFLLEGEMGSGKTTLIKAMAAALGSNDHFSSPTYSIINEYSCGDDRIFHMDLYRLSSPQELADLGFEEYAYSGKYCFIEWPELAAEFLPQNYVKIDISRLNNKRYFRCTHYIE